MEITTVGIDPGKTVFHLVGLNVAGETVVRKRFSRAQLSRFTANLPVRLIGMEACPGGSLPWPRTARTRARGASAARPVHKDEQERLF